MIREELVEARRQLASTVAMFLLPAGVDVDTRLKRELLEWSVCQEKCHKNTPRQLREIRAA